MEPKGLGDWSLVHALCGCPGAFGQITSPMLRHIRTPYTDSSATASTSIYRVLGGHTISINQGIESRIAAPLADTGEGDKGRQHGRGLACAPAA